MAKDFSTDLSKRKEKILEKMEATTLAQSEESFIKGDLHSNTQGLNVNSLFEDEAAEPRVNVTCSLAWSDLQKLDSIAKSKNLRRAEVTRRILEAALGQVRI